MPPENSLLWRVELPAQQGSRLGGSKPPALLFSEGAGDPQPIPLGVGKALLQAQREGWNPTSEEQLQEKISHLELQLAWERLITLLNRRDFTAFEAHERLRKEGFGEEAISTAVSQAQNNRFIDDERYAQSFAQAKALQGWGRQRIERELQQRGIEHPNDVLLDPVLGGPEAELERAREVLQRKALPRKNPYPSLVRFLVSRGFNLSLAKQVVGERLEACSPDV